MIKSTQLIAPACEIVPLELEVKWNHQTCEEDELKPDLDEEKEQGESLKHVEEITSHSTDDI